MQPDKLEEFILDHRDQFDDMEPRPELWDGIRKRKAPVLNIGWKAVAWRAAAVVIIFFSSYIFFRLTDKEPVQPSGNNYAEMQEDQSPLVNELKEAEIYYTSQIEFMRAEAIRLSDGDPGVKEIIDTEMTDLDQVYEELKRDLKDNTDNEEVIEAMIQNYRIKLEILEEILWQLKESKEPINSSSDENEAVAL
jgi:predicted CopG family antitoxin